MSAIFDFSSLLTVVLLLICMATFVREIRPGIYDGGKTYERGFKGRSGGLGFLWKLSRIGERLSPYVSVCCAIMAVHVLFFK
mmetsp:Transcript_26424/g.57941  ORF Transcript_26424/g.57941 Transcript_26424/m.57941 type:complete len:82 (+) Transcript_26424:382-627(+)|eukprot:CAMPEP_0178565354 /NCGR_PEP_ID=MMETSP0697-20121206/14116_1 /TAXON_ID=265572 /ORGANISM="Extubocellulus spinifer, Strain CCMP396" /LENGTH=81 /DNA_ID=CAMNT_0020198953 /DNA_START=251 /DNA_END=496 /DNA_ORIENTATION=-